MKQHKQTKLELLFWIVVIGVCYAIIGALYYENKRVAMEEARAHRSDGGHAIREGNEPADRDGLPR